MRSLVVGGAQEALCQVEKTVAILTDEARVDRQTPDPYRLGRATV